MAPPPPAAAATAARPLSAAPGRPASPWIDGPWRDLAFYIATPVFLIPLILLRSGSYAIQDVILYIGGFGALGHHLPGMMRAYGDRALFQRFRMRLVLAPLFLVPVCVFFTVNDLGGVILLTFFWTNWHSLMQIFGFARIYDAKAGTSTPLMSRLDQALCFAWISAPLFLSDNRFGSVLAMWYGSGGPIVSPAFVVGFREVWQVGIAAVTAAWLLHTLFRWRDGFAPSPAKLLLFASSFVFWWFCMATVDNLLIGVALFNVFHDVQYLAIVWTFNRSRVAKDPNVGAFSRFLFRGRLSLVGVYVGLVVAYGAMGQVSESISQELMRNTLLGVLAASAFLHFYLDGFIWKVREQSTREGLGVGGGGANIHLGGRLPGWAAHGAKWLLFVVPLGTMYWWDVTDERPEREWRQALAAAVPGSAEAQTGLGALLDLRQEGDRVLALHRRAIELKPEHPVSHNNLGVALYLMGRTEEARRELEEAIRLFPEYSVAHRHLATLLMQEGERAEAERHLRIAIAEDPRDGKAHAGLGRLVEDAGDVHEAVRLFERALELEPTERTALNGLAWTYATHPDVKLRDGALAVERAERLLDLSGRGNPLVLDTVAAAYAEAGRFEDALAMVEEAIQLVHRHGRTDVAAVFEEHRAHFARGEAWRSGPTL